ncbi:MAG: RNA polymerase sigma factor [Armatimonadota bacterium]
MAPENIPDDEAALVKKAAACSAEAFDALMELFHTHLAIIVGKYAKRREDRADLQAEIVEKLLANDKRALRDWRPIAPFSAYLTTIATRHCLQWLERHKRLQEHTVRNLPGPNRNEEDIFDHICDPDTTADPPDQLKKEERAKTVRTAFAELSNDDRLILALRFEEEMTGPGIARILGISQGAARKRIYDALRRLKDALLRLEPELFRNM